MQENAREMYSSGCKMLVECRGMQRNARGTHGYVWKVTVECRRIPGERMVVGAKCLGMQGVGKESVLSARGIQGNAGECQGNA